MAMLRQTPAHWAAERCSSCTVTALIRKEEPFTIIFLAFRRGKDRGGCLCFRVTAVSYARVLSGHTSVLSILATYNDLAVVQSDERARTPRDLANSEFHLEAAEMLHRLEGEDLVCLELSEPTTAQGFVNSPPVHTTQRIAIESKR